MEMKKLRTYEEVVEENPNVRIMIDDPCCFMLHDINDTIYEYIAINDMAMVTV